MPESSESHTGEPSGMSPQWRGIFIDARIAPPEVALAVGVVAAMEGHLYRCPNSSTLDTSETHSEGRNGGASL